MCCAARGAEYRFEYHSKGMWASTLAQGERRDLKRTLQTLHAYGYSCFWQGDRGGLAEASGERWCDSFEWRGHSNIVCSHLQPLVRAMRSLDCIATPPGVAPAERALRRSCGLH